jgi:hypothetical protein
MRRYLGSAVAAVTVGAAVLTGASAAAGSRAPVPAAASAGTWGTAEEVPGTAALNKGGSAQVNSVSCTGVGDCSAGGGYLDGSGNQHAFAVSETNGTWRTAQEIHGAVGPVNSVSCAAPGDCGAGGGSALAGQAFVTSQTGGTWGTAEQVPGLAALNQGGNAEVLSVSCGSVGNCSAVGSYTDGSGGLQAFVVNEAKGTWGTAQEVPGTAALNQGNFGAAESVSCASAGNCSAGGFYEDSSSSQEAFVVTEVHGTWGTAKEVPGTSSLNKGEDAAVQSVSCVSAGNCSAGGFFDASLFADYAFVVSETNGTWGTAHKIPGTLYVSQELGGGIYSLSCASAGNCGTGGIYNDNTNRSQAFVLSQKNGTWGTAEEVPGTAALNKGGFAYAISLSCAAAGDCSAGGLYDSGHRHFQAFVAGETNGAWAKAEEVPGTAALNRGGIGETESVSCASLAHCGAGGYYADSSGHQQAFVVTET